MHRLVGSKRSNRGEPELSARSGSTDLHIVSTLASTGGSTSEDPHGTRPATSLDCVTSLNDGPLASYADAFRRNLTGPGYAKNSVANCVRNIAHFAQ